jgi:hypothetical protein
MFASIAQFGLRGYSARLAAAPPNRSAPGGDHRHRNDPAGLTARFILQYDGLTNLAWVSVTMLHVSNAISRALP